MPSRNFRAVAISDDTYTALRRRALATGRTLRELVDDLVRRGLSVEAEANPRPLDDEARRAWLAMCRRGVA